MVLKSHDERFTQGLVDFLKRVLRALRLSGATLRLLFSLIRNRERWASRSMKPPRLSSSSDVQVYAQFDPSPPLASHPTQDPAHHNDDILLHSGDRLELAHETVTPCPEVIPLESDIADCSVSSTEERNSEDSGGRCSSAETLVDNEWRQVRAVPVVPTDLPRYTDTFPISKWDDDSTYKLQPLKFKIPSRSECSLPEGWQELIDFEGSCYFYHPVENVLTGSWVYDRDQEALINKFIEVSRHKRSQMGTFNFNDRPLVIWLARDEDDKWSCYYYYVDLESRTIFWLDDYDVKLDLSEVEGGCFEGHTKLFMECQYWTHIQYFPVGHKVEAKELRNLLNLTNHALVDLVTSKDSTVTQTPEDLELLRKIIPNCERDLQEGGDGCPWIVARLMHRFCRDRYLNFYGQRGARLGRQQSVYGEDLRSMKRSFLFRLLSPFLFNQHYGLLHQFGDVTTDSCVVLKSWRSLIKRLTHDWREQVTLGTILLAVNVSFLDIPNVVPEGTAVSTPAQVASSLSIMCSLSTAILGLFLIRNHRSLDSVGMVYQYLHADARTRWRPELIAIFCTLPFVSLIWGLILFLFGFLYQCFSSLDLRARFIVGAFVLCVVLVITPCAYYSWKWGSGSVNKGQSLRSLLLQKLRRCKFVRKRKTPNSDSDASRSSIQVWVRTANVGIVFASFRGSFDRRTAPAHHEEALQMA
ncbi:hypothetical protein Moror_5478 [Moniliophthora roreri MCA 2997]|uniref:WW domain-containing protein n=1 Tax=Moniliophthora roreri (strain MCA 2997) TaxID=1381753 RepID=V2WN31_MONRO|nr:hypothetical protein Moror_5478 [Moniliophthora roreri MCA 2997]